MEKYKIVFSDGSIKILVAEDVSLEEAKEIVSRQSEPNLYEIILQEQEQAAG